jgi:hypothetical protein
LVQNAASTSPGDPVLGLAYNTSNLVAYYRQAGTGTLTSIALATLASATAAYSSGGFVQISSTNAPGQYRFDIPNAVLATAGEWNITFSGAPAGTVGNMETHTIKVIVMAFDLFTTTGFTQQQLTESYPTVNTAPTLAQALFLMMQYVAPTNRSISGTVETVLGINGTATAAVCGLNSSTNPTAITRTS